MTPDLTHARYLAAVDEEMSAKDCEVEKALLEHSAGTFFQMLTPKGLELLCQHLGTNHLTPGGVWELSRRSQADDQAKEVLTQLFDMSRAAKSGCLELLITELIRKGMQPEHISPDRLASE